MQLTMTKVASSPVAHSNDRKLTEIGESLIDLISSEDLRDFDVPRRKQPRISLEKLRMLLDEIEQSSASSTPSPVN